MHCWYARVSALLVVGVSVVQATGGLAQQRPTSLAILSGYFQPTDAVITYGTEKHGGIGVALMADVAISDKTTIGLLVQYGEFATKPLRYPDDPGAPVLLEFSSANGYTLLLAPMIRTEFSQRSIRPFFSVGVGFARTVIGPIEYEFTREGDPDEDKRFTIPGKREEAAAFVGQVGVDIGPVQGSYAVVLAASGALSTTDSDLGSSFWTVQLGLRLRFGGS